MKTHIFLKGVVALVSCLIFSLPAWGQLRGEPVDNARDQGGRITPEVTSGDLTSIPITQTPEYMCGSPEHARHERPRGQWKGYHNTNNWELYSRSGEDFFVKTSEYGAFLQALYEESILENRVQTHCVGGDTWKYVDHDGGKEDWCVFTSGDPNWVSPCPEGYTPTHAQKTCYRAERPSVESKVRRPKGQWNPLHNTNNWEYITAPGQDYYRKKSNHNKKVYLTCIIAMNEDYTRRVDFDGNQDWCVETTTTYLSQDWTPMSCPVGTILSDIHHTYTPSSTNTHGIPYNLTGDDTDTGDVAVQSQSAIDSRPCDPCPGGWGSYDGANCLVATKTPNQTPFIKNGHILMTSPNAYASGCPAGTSWTGAHCDFGAVPTGRQAFTYNQNVYLKDACDIPKTYSCVGGATDVPQRRPRGAWKAFHDTTKWKLQTFWGKDYFVPEDEHKVNQVLDTIWLPTFSETVEAICVNGRKVDGGDGALSQFASTWADVLGAGQVYDDGPYRTDLIGKEDYCVIAVTSGETRSPCPVLYDAKHDTQSCVRPYIPGTNTIRGGPKGNWTPLHNTNNWQKMEVPGRDYYRKKSNHSARVQLSCLYLNLNPSVEKSTYMLDMQGNKDMCGIPVMPIHSDTQAMSCSPGYSLVSTP